MLFSDIITASGFVILIFWALAEHLIITLHELGLSDLHKIH